LFSKEEIFKDIQKVLQNDYAGYLEKKLSNHPELYTISNDMSERTFEETIQDYLLDFRDGHLWFYSKKSEIPHVGFSVRRYKDTLYVTESPQENRIMVGDKIVEIDCEDVDKLALKYRKRLEEELPERQRWNSVIRRSKVVCVERNGERFEMPLVRYEAKSYKPCHDFKQINNETVYIKITDFAEEEPIQRLLEDNRGVLERTKNLIIDVRVNHGGNDSFYFPLLNYIFDCKINFSDLFNSDEVMYTNYTERNCRLWTQELENYLKQELNKDTIEMLNKEISLFKKNQDKGLVEVTEDDDFVINGRENPTNVYVLSDCYCGSSGDTFVANVKKSPKVTVVGRATMGIMDYFNVVTIDYGDYEFGYGISKMNGNYSINGKGVEPHIYIPWTPEHINEDKDLAYVLEMIKIRNELQRN